MADYSNWPTAFDVEVLLKSAAFWPTDEAKIVMAQEQAAIGAASAADEFQKRTGWVPFLCPSGAPDVTRYYDATDGEGYLRLDAGLLAVTSVTVSDAAQEQGEGYWLEPRNAAADGVPYTGLRFNHGYGMTRWIKPGGIAVTGRWGYCTSVPVDAWQSVQQAAGLIALMGVENLQSVASISMDGFSKALDIVGILTQKDLADKWKREFAACVNRYMRVVV